MLPFSPNKLRIGSLQKKKTGAVLVDLTIADETFYGTAVSPAKLFALGQLIRNCSFTLITGTDTKRIQCLKNGVPQRLVLALLFNI